jgi:hypothetical protein
VADRQFGCKIKKIVNFWGKKKKKKKNQWSGVMILINKIVINIQRNDDKEEINK